MHVDASASRRAQKRWREYPTVCDDDRNVELLSGEERQSLAGSYLRGLVDDYVLRERVLFDGRRFQPVAAPRGSVRLSPNGHDFVAVLDAAPERRHGGFGRAHED